MAAEGQTDQMAADMEVHMKQRCVTEFLHVEKMAPSDIHQHLLSVHGDRTWDTGTVKQWVLLSSSGNSGSGAPPLVQMSTSTACRHFFITGENAQLML